MTIWHSPDQIPPVPKGAMNEFVLAVYRATTKKTYSFAATYLHSFLLDYPDGCPLKPGTSEVCKEDCADGCPTTGWYLLVGDDNYDAGVYSHVYMRDGDKIKGWTEIPDWNDQPIHTEGPTGHGGFTQVAAEG